MPGTTLTKPEASSSQQYPASNGANKKTKGVSYSKWGYFFIAPFFLAFAVFSLVPLVSTFYNSFFENYWVGLTQVGPDSWGCKITVLFFPMATWPLTRVIPRSSG